MKNNNNANSNNVALVSPTESLRTLKGTEPGDTIVVVHEHGQLSLQSVMSRAGHRGRANGHIEIRLQNVGTQAMVDHLLYDTLPVGFVSVMKVQIPRRAEKSASAKATKTTVVVRPSQSESREVVEDAQEAPQSTEAVVVAEAQAVVETIAQEAATEVSADAEAVVAEEQLQASVAEMLAVAVAPEEPQTEAVGGEESVQVEQPEPLSLVSVME